MCVFCELTSRMAEDYALIFDAQMEIDAMTEDPDGRESGNA